MNIAKKYNYCMPIIDNSAPHSFLKAKDMRHILIENLQEKIAKDHGYKIVKHIHQLFVKKIKK